ncbi:TetR family transcriptional regulator [bacterium (Candidatus Blackallbacteria) CG17_big_fil_post_rev_8_21_14_2_50_48_46]|uniref:TetR family transcriptional regulator n=1 Tax=bacterium (Candidatus Blackallbacteria) CG17_big_fil_post_rev_8_21_14_2_50_48_46 TaxID=2014261 RepID=A0A2M7G891_9BACT|nr:MAG: TetR family transcriptional regulator [bacterium (Candidatus Blackallbacteria) CG18_big_fil_WC_8_21_14_2_50_49_26]PIW18292.1 MAG: TetR family transcriptional regulator [bacterium (Candidatus Blackallbacteria) CG17_big_fil_post_rev_8_21_14_2_50_48_46]PIW49516.1 MAG: TetR family transcriptional regulator [bacterium (Candidatus Blackallbacteria) CG13_big_fil_rev_8_21_14_2_50_49_14]
MRKGNLTRNNILEKASSLATRVGLDGLSIGQLAGELQMSKSGLFAHFGSKEELQIQVLQAASERFTDSVVKPALKRERGKPRLQALFENWLEWGLSEPQTRSGCLFVAAAIELDDQPGPVRDELVKIQARWIETLERTLELGQISGQFQAALNPAEAVQELYGILLSAHFYVRLMGQPEALKRARHLFYAFLERIQI